MLPLSFSLKNHTISLLILTAQSQLSELPDPPLCCCRRELLALSESFWGAMKGPEENSRGKKRRKQPGLVRCECISWAAALRCASLCWLLQEGGCFRPRLRCWVLKPANTPLKINLRVIVPMHVFLILHDAEVWSCLGLLRDCFVADQRAV